MEPMSFGKHKGELPSAVPLTYLRSCYESMPYLSSCVEDELERRGVNVDAWIKKTPQGPDLEKQSRSDALNSKNRSREKLVLQLDAKVNRIKSSGGKPSDKQLEMLARLGGDRHDTFLRLRCDFIKAGGDLSACPFDTKDYAYTGPR